MIVFNSFNLSRLLSQQVAPVCLVRESGGRNAFLKFFLIANWVPGFIWHNRSFLRLWSQ
jgi:hypothetical protein